MAISASNERDLSKLAKLANKLMVAAPTSITAVTSEPSQSEQLQEMKVEISRLLDSVAALQTTSWSMYRGAPQPPNKHQKVCWHHHKFGNATRKCSSLCELSGNASGKHWVTSGTATLQHRSSMFFLTKHDSGIHFLVNTGAEVSVVPALTTDCKCLNMSSLHAVNKTTIATRGNCSSTVS